MGAFHSVFRELSRLDGIHGNVFSIFLEAHDQIQCGIEVGTTPCTHVSPCEGSLENIIEVRHMSQWPSMKRVQATYRTYWTSCRGRYFCVMVSAWKPDSNQILYQDGNCLFQGLPTWVKNVRFERNTVCIHNAKPFYGMTPDIRIQVDRIQSRFFQVLNHIRRSKGTGARSPSLCRRSRLCRR